MESAGATTSGVASSGESASMAGKPGYYTVKPGDTLVRIGLDHGQNWRDIARWNQIENANLIEVGQVLRVRPEAAASRT
ncbi:MAG: LysM domain-containing protein, partial [Betaproteobacteria bacterium]|nr:LysM domain-containing protein [Betaproteobacteria bacterium]